MLIEKLNLKKTQEGPGFFKHCGVAGAAQQNQVVVIASSRALLNP